VLAVAAIGLTATVFARATGRGLIIVWTVGAGLVAVWLILLGGALWSYAAEITLSGVLLVVLAVSEYFVGVYVITVLVAMICWVIPALAFVGLMGIVLRSRTEAIAMLSASWRHGNFNGFIMSGFAGLAAGLAAGSIVGGTILLIYNYPRLALMLGGLVLAAVIVTGVRWAWSHRRNLQLSATVTRTAVGMISAIIAFSALAWLTPQLDPYVGNAKAVLYVAISAAGLVVTAAIAFSLYRIAGVGLRFLRHQMVRLVSGKIDPDEWAARIRKAEPEEQALLLRIVRPTRFGLDLESTIDLVGGLATVAQREPAISAFDAKVTELLALRRQHRAD
jgi:hypothetical protein